MFWKKVNRGLLLGGVLLVGLIVFIVVKEVQFRREIPVLRETARDFLGATVEMNRIEGTVGEDGKLTDAQKAARLEAFRTLIRTYWDASEKDITSGLSDFQEATKLFEAYQESSREELMEWHMNLPDRQIFIQSNGPDRAIVSINYYDLTVRSKGWKSEQIFLFDYYVMPSETGSGKGSSDLPEDFSEDDAVAVFDKSYSGIIYLDMKRTSEGWKVVGIRSYVNSAYPVAVENGGDAT